MVIRLKSVPPNYSVSGRYVLPSFSKTMDLKLFVTLSITSLSILGLSSSFIPAQANTRVENRVHCVWRGSGPLKYKSCSPQVRTCRSLSTVGGGGRTECTGWRNRF
jgi:hypothetical protein